MLWPSPEGFFYLRYNENVTKIYMKGDRKMKENVSEFVGGGILSLIFVSFINSWQLIVVVAILYGLTLFGNLTTGLLYAKQTHTYSRDTAEKAVYKKTGMIIGIIVVFCVDLIIMTLSRSAGFVYSIPIFGCILSGYSAVHELISMLQNLKKLGNKVPAALEDAANKAGEALNQGKIPDLPQYSKGGKQ
jgi:phage-related holin